MKKSVIIIKTKILALEVAGTQVPALHYFIFVDGKRFGTHCSSFSELQETIICALVLQNPDTDYEIVFDPLRVGSFNCYLPLLSK